MYWDNYLGLLFTVARIGYCQQENVAHFEYVMSHNMHHYETRVKFVEVLEKESGTGCANT